MVKVTTSKNKEYDAAFAWMTVGENHCVIQWEDERKLTEIIPELLDLEWIKMVDEFDQEIINSTALDLFYISKKEDMITAKFE